MQPSYHRQDFQRPSWWNRNRIPPGGELITLKASERGGEAGAESPPHPGQPHPRSDPHTGKKPTCCKTGTQPPRTCRTQSRRHETQAIARPISQMGLIKSHSGSPPKPRCPGSSCSCPNQHGWPTIPSQECSRCVLDKDS